MGFPGQVIDYSKCSLRSEKPREFMRYGLKSQRLLQYQVYCITVYLKYNVVRKSAQFL